MRNYIIIAVLSLLFIGSLYMLKKEYDEKIRFKDNYDTVVNDANNAEILHTNEIKAFHKEIDSLRDASGIREKTVNVAFQTKYNYKDSTLLIPVIDTIHIKDTIKIVKNYHISKPCYDLSLQSINDTITENLQLHDKLTGFLYWERPHKFLFIRWGAKKYYLKILSECNGIIIPDKLIITE
ncbi:MAG: hypothetical protein NTZ33_13880 [Bacteroidetes bacterium]|nr:hypothetical protein [Bacteroidota bacterium]